MTSHVRPQIRQIRDLGEVGRQWSGWWLSHASQTSWQINCENDSIIWTIPFGIYIYIQVNTSTYTVIRINTLCFKTIHDHSIIYGEVVASSRKFTQKKSWYSTQVSLQARWRAALSNANCAVLESSLNSFWCLESVSAKVLVDWHWHMPNIFLHRESMGTVKCLFFRHFFNPLLEYPASPLSGAFSSWATNLSIPGEVPWRQKSGLCPSCMKRLGDYDPETDHWCPSIIYHPSASGSNPLSTQKLLLGQQLVIPLVITSVPALGTCRSLLTVLPTAACRDQVGSHHPRFTRPYRSTPWPLMVPSIAWPKLHISTIFLYPLYPRLSYLYSIYI